MKLRFTSLRASVRPFVAAAAMTSMLATGCAPVEDNVDSTGQLVTYTLATTTDTAPSTSSTSANTLLCRACTRNSQCGSGAYCLRTSTTTAGFCGAPCGSGCRTGYSCGWIRTPSTYIRQCVPSSGTCSTTTDAGTTPPADAGTPPTDSGTPPSGGSLKAFPGAEGFGAVATGGRGGRVVYVTNLNASGAGSLAEALSVTGPRYVVFRVSGVIPGPVSIRQGDVTIAGQTSPGGVIVRGGIYCDNVYDANNCRNVVLRHVRSRQSNDDTLRVTGGERIMVDHCSFANASDESIEVTRSQNVTVQYSTLAEPVGDHYQWGGLLVNYSKDRFPLDNLSFHHNVWNGVYGRLPELSCEENADGPGTSNCAGRTLHAEISNNLIFDAGDPLWYNRCVGVNEGNWCSPSSRDFLLGVNWVGNVMALRTSSSQPMFVPDVSQNTANALFYTDNLLKRGSSSQAGTATLASRSSRFGYPSITLHAASGLQSLLQVNAGAFPRDPMDTRLASYLSNSVDSRPASWSGGQGINRGDALRTNFTTAPPAPVDTDNDGMPDSWESANGLNPNVADHNGTGLSVRFTGVSGYTNLECYLNQLAETRVRTNQ